MFFIFSVIIYGLWVCNKRLNICLLPHEVMVYNIKIFATSYFFNK